MWQKTRRVLKTVPLRKASTGRRRLAEFAVDLAARLLALGGRPGSRSGRTQALIAGGLLLFLALVVAGIVGWTRRSP